MVDLSIIIPTFNRLWCLPEAISSCGSTKYNIEIIVVDDGSTDQTWEWLQNQPHLTILRQENWGKCWAVNFAFEKAKGKYIKFLDSDDILVSNSIDEQLALAEEEQSDAVVSGYQLIDENGELLKEKHWVYCDDFIAQQLGECDSSHYSAYLFRKDFITDIPHRPDYALRDDRLFVLEVALKNPKISIHHGYGLLHRSHQNSRLQFTEKKTLQNIQHLNLYRKILALLTAKGQLNDRRIKASIKVLWELAQWIALDSPNEANELVKWIFQLDPNFKLPKGKIKGRLYQLLGFTKTAQILNLIRQLKK